MGINYTKAIINTDGITFDNVTIKASAISDNITVESAGPNNNSATVTFTVHVEEVLVNGRVSVKCNTSSW